jgi:CDP-glucose 4,6-dehydratase
MVFHLAAQPLVRRSYRNPQETWSTNVIGTVNILEACRHTASILGVVVVTSDKCYEERDKPSGFTENDALGGLDPYSASKGAAELVVRSYRHSFFGDPHGPLIASARAGNVIGGGDWGADRLVPDAMRAIADGRSLEIRHPNAVRPWQHVLDCLSGYLLLGKQLLARNAQFATAWNFGSEIGDHGTVTAVLEQLRQHVPDLHWHTTSVAQPREAPTLRLDSTRARHELGWKPTWDLERSLYHTAHWYRAFRLEKRILSRDQLREYLRESQRAN